ncbi:MAG: G8 domain-containing protein [Thermodesulfobacteriota bacterium]
MRSMNRIWVVVVGLCGVAWLAPRPAGAVGCQDFVPAGCTRVGPADKIDVVVQNKCYVFDENSTGSYSFDKINILDGGKLLFVDPGDGKTIDFRVSALLVEKGGVFQAGSPACPIGKEGGRLAIGLYGDDPTDQGTKTPTGADAGIQCMTNPAGGGDPSRDLRCFPSNAYADGHYCTQGGDDPCSSTTAPGQNPKNKLLEPYGKLNFDDNPWGYKTIGVAYGGTLALYGYKGAQGLQDPSWASANDPADHCKVPDPSMSTLDVTELGEWAKLAGTSWARLTGQVDDKGSNLTTLTLDRAVATQEPNHGWRIGDEIVIGATDWYANHSEQRTIRNVIPSPSGTQIQVDLLNFPHYTQMFTTGQQSDFTNPVSRTAVDMRAVVGLLSRSIQVYSLGKSATEPFLKTIDCTADKNPNPSCYFGGHVIARQGFRQVAIQGVEFKQLGQGGRMGHYPVHFHLAKSTDYTGDPKTQRAFVKDSSVWDSMTRFVVLHGTHEVTVARNVGYLSLGHGYYVEDGSEIENRICHNLGVGARAALQQYVTEQQKMEHWCGGEPPPAARVVPPILDGSIRVGSSSVAMSATGSDTFMPVMFWTMNTYNEFVGNAAVSVHGFGSCYWLLGSALSGPSIHHQFDGFASFNSGAAQAPLLRFRGNSCMTSPLALPTSREVAPGAEGPLDNYLLQAKQTGFTALLNPYFNAKSFSDNYARPIVTGNYVPALDPQNCSNGGAPSVLDKNTKNCVTTVLDRFSTSFNWAEINFSAVWLRPGYFLFANGAVTDQLFGGLAIVTGGDWQQAPPAYLALALNNLFVGTTQGDGPSNVYARRSGPRFPVSSSENLASYSLCPAGGPTTCMFPAAGTGFWKGAFQPKRLVTIYDGPTYADGNTFLNVGAWECDAQPCAGAADPSKCKGFAGGELVLPCGIYSSTTQPKGPSGGNNVAVLDAAIGWKQRNGFYYPPAFDYRRSSFLKGRSDSLNMCLTAAPGDYQDLRFQPGSCRHNVVDRTQTYLTGNIVGLNGQPISESGPLNQLQVGTIDFATILLDLDGSLTGSTSTIDGRPSPGLTTSVSRNVFYDAPSQTPECLSHGVQTSPYTFISTVVGQLSGPPSAASNTILREGASWGLQPAIGIYRQWKLKADHDREQTKPCTQVCDGGQYGCARASFMGMASLAQASYLTMTEPPGLSDSQTGGLYYIDTNSGAQSLSCVVGNSFTQATFEGTRSYVLYNLFPQRDSKTSYQLYVGDVTNIGDIEFRWVRVTVHEIDGALQKVEQLCDPREPNQWCSSLRPPDPVDGVLTVTVDHTKLLPDSAFDASSRPDYDRCMPRDLCYFDASANKCRRCDPAAPVGAANRCLRAGDFLPVDVQSMNAVDKNNRKPLDAVCEDWSSKVSGQVQINNGAKVTAMDCPAGGCLGFAFKLPSGFQAKPYQSVSNPQGKKPLSRCFVESAWMKDRLVQTSNDPQCGAPRPQASSDFCSDPQVDLPAEKDAAIDGDDPGANRGEHPELEVAGGDPDGTPDASVARAAQAGAMPVRSLIAFDGGAIESFLAHHALARATLELTTSRAVAGEEALLDVHPLLLDFHEGDPDELPLTELVPANAVQRASRVLGVVPIGTGGKRRLPVLPGRDAPPPGGPGGSDDVPGVTWNCAVDLETDDHDDETCHVPWETVGGDHAAATAPSVVASGPAGTVLAWDVTEDVLNGVSSWLVRLKDESSPTQVVFHSEEGAAQIGDPGAGPVLILE